MGRHRPTGEVTSGTQQGWKWSGCVFCSSFHWGRKAGALWLLPHVPALQAQHPRGLSPWPCAAPESQRHVPLATVHISVTLGMSPLAGVHPHDIELIPIHLYGCVPVILGTSLVAGAFSHHPGHIPSSWGTSSLAGADLYYPEYSPVS